MATMRSELVGNLLTCDALEVLRVLRSAREKLRGGYAYDWCYTEGSIPPHTRLGEMDPEKLGHSLIAGVPRVHPLGVICDPEDEGVRFFDTRGALRAAAGANVDALMLCEDLVRWITPGGELGGRVPLVQVLKAFDAAVLRAQGVNRRRD